MKLMVLTLTGGDILHFNPQSVDAVKLPESTRDAGYIVVAGQRYWAKHDELLRVVNRLNEAQTQGAA